MTNAPTFKPVASPRIAALGLSLEFYDEAIPGYMARLEAQLGRFLAPIAARADIVSRRLCWRDAHVVEQVQAAEAAEADALLLIPMSYAASMMTVPALRDTSLPIVIWNTQEAYEVARSYTSDDLLMNHVTQGTQDLTNVLLRNRIRFGLESGHYADAPALDRLGEWLAAARAMQSARGLRVGRLGAPFEGMGDFSVDEQRMAHDWGPEVAPLPVDQLAACFNDARTEDAEALVEQDQARFEVAPEVEQEMHVVSARLELAMRRLVAEAELGAFTMNFREIIEAGGVPTLPFLGLNKLLADGLGYAGEGDVMTAAHMAQIRQLCGIATFTEIYTIDYATNAMVMTHMQECNPAMARDDRKVRLVRKPFWAPGVEDYVGMHFTLQPGPVTLTAITPNADGRFTYVCREACIRDMAPFPEYDAPHWIAELGEPVGDFLTRYGLAGGPHHLVAAPGCRAEALRKLAYLQGFGFIDLFPEANR